MEFPLRADHIFIAGGYTDMRRSIDGLSAIVSSTLSLSPFQSSLFLFCGRRRDRFKALLWQGDGFLLLYKRLESGRLQWPVTTRPLLEISFQQYRWLMEGLSTVQSKAVKKISHPCFRL